MVAVDEIAIGESIEDVVPVEEIGLTGSYAVNGTVAAYTATISTNSPESISSIAVSVKRGTGSASLPHTSEMTDNGDGTFTCDVSGISYGTTYYYAFDASVSMTDGTTLAVHSATNSYRHLATGDVYVSQTGTGENPYSTAETAATSVSAALAICDDGATIHILPGTYEITNQILVDKSVSIIGGSGDPSAVVITNTASAASGNAGKRIFRLSAANITVSGLTMSGGQVYGGTAKGGNLFIDTYNGIVVTNCVIENGLAVGGAQAGAAHLHKGLVTHCIIRGNGVDSTGSSSGATVAFTDDTAGFSNCLFIDNNSDYGAYLFELGTGAMENSTVVRSTIANGTKAVNFASSGNVRNTVFAGLANGEGESLGFDTSERAHYYNCAFDAGVPSTAGGGAH